MKLLDCLNAMRGLGVSLARRGDGLAIQSVTFKPDEAVTQVLRDHKAVLLAVLPVREVAYPVALVLGAVEAYFERETIMLESGAMPEEVEAVALRQAWAVMGVSGALNIS